MIGLYSHKAVDQGDLPDLTLLCGLWKSTKTFWQNELQMWVFWLCEREREWVAYKKSSDCKNSLSAFISFRPKKIIREVKATQMILSHITTWSGSGTVLMWSNISLFHSFSSKQPNEATEPLWKQGLYRGVLLVACRQQEAHWSMEMWAPLSDCNCFQICFIHARFLPSGRQLMPDKVEMEEKKREAPSFCLFFQWKLSGFETWPNSGLICLEL